MDQTIKQNSNKITKGSLVIYCLVLGLCLIIFSGFYGYNHDTSFLYGFLLCVGPSIIFVLISVFLPIPSLVGAKTGKGVIVLYCIAYVIKYALLIGIPFIGIVHSDIFNKWAMLATTIIAPIFVIIYKFIFANYVSKKAKNNVKL